MSTINQSPIEAMGIPAPANRLIRINELASSKGQPGIVPISPATLWRWVKAGKFPAPIRLSDRVTAWESAKVRAWIEAQAGGRA